MKKYWSNPRYKAYNQRRAEKSLRARLEFQDSKRREHAGTIGVDRYERRIQSYRRGYTPVPAPEEFSLIRNPDKVVRFIANLSYCFDNHQRVWVILRQVKDIDYDAIVVLLSAMIRFKSQGITFNGDFPKHGDSAKVLQESGFFENLYRTFADTDEYVIEPQRENYISTHGLKVVDSELTSDILLHAARAVWNEPRRCNGVQTALVELMQNTFSHADPSVEGQRHWWLSVNTKKGDKTVRFSFVDYGVGIFKSLESKRKGTKFFGALERLRERFRYGNNAALLRLILQGELHRTVTEAYYRGKGLPALLDCLQENWFSNLHIISNDVYGAVDKDEYRLLKSPFNGTFVYWEIKPDNESIADVNDQNI